MSRPSASVLALVTGLAICAAGCGSSTSTALVPRTTTSLENAPPWVHQLGSGRSGASGGDSSNGIAVDDSGDAYIGGFANGSLPGSSDPHVGGTDAFIAKYGLTGNRLWVHEFGARGDDQTNGVAVDAADDLYVAGSASGVLPGSSDNGSAFVAKYNATGMRVWVHQLGTASDSANGVAVDGTGDVEVTGSASGELPGSSDSGAVFVAKYTSAGNRLWVHQLGSTPEDEGNAIAADSAGDVYVAGTAHGTIPGSGDKNLGHADAFLAKYSSSGGRVWVHQFGSTGGTDGANGVAVGDSHNIYVVGYTSGTLPGSVEKNAGYQDGFVVKYSDGGTRQWAREFGTSGDGEFASVVAVDGAGNVFVAGQADGTLAGTKDTYAGNGDVCLLKYSGAGSQVWVHQFGTNEEDGATAVAVARSDIPYLTGWTEGDLPGSSDAFAGASAEGGSDAFVARNVP